MSLLEEWRSIAYDYTKSKSEIDFFWNQYFKKEAQFYSKLLNITEHPILDTVENFAVKFDTDIITMVGFLDGINDSLKIPNNIEKVTEKTIVTLDYDLETLYQNAIKSDAKHIYTLTIWDTVLPNRKSISLQSIENKNISLQPIQNKPKCPICGSTNLSKITTTKKVMKIAAFGIFGMGDNGKTWKCNNCDSKF
ncbi:MAG: SEC-C domain-containing protein [Lachnospiraceae bacterium]|nr:SEC-C domain-containing protein [Lachnospiraceae bacterium]MBD5538322.1 SEC-C domain-containing protein [Lachnospiraceae bacterium]